MSEYVINRRHGPWVSLHALTTELMKQEDQGMLSESCDESESCPRIPGPVPGARHWPGVKISIGRVAGPGCPAECGPRSPRSLLQFSGHCPSSVWAGLGVGHWPARAQPSPALPTLAHLALLQIIPGHRDTDFPYATKNKNILDLSFNKFYLGIMDDS